jgi:hypothetical protein
MWVKFIETPLYVVTRLVHDFFPRLDRSLAPMSLLAAAPGRPIPSNLAPPSRPSPCRWRQIWPPLGVAALHRSLPPSPFSSPRVRASRSSGVPACSAASPVAASRRSERVSTPSFLRSWVFLSWLLHSGVAVGSGRCRCAVPDLALFRLCRVLISPAFCCCSFGRPSDLNLRVRFQANWWENLFVLKTDCTCKKSTYFA